MNFKFFSDTDNFAFRLDEPSNCSVCSKVGLWFDAEMYAGANEIKCICDSCLSSGGLIQLGIEPNDSIDNGTEDFKTIIYKTPSLPSWQDIQWPLINGSYPVFERIASKEDFVSKEEFIDSFIASGDKNTDLDWLWGLLPDKKLASYKGASDISVYLFRLEEHKYWLWDSN